MLSVLSVPDENYYRNASCVRNLISTILLNVVCSTAKQEVAILFILVLHNRGLSSQFSSLESITLNITPMLHNIIIFEQTVIRYRIQYHRRIKLLS
jgi:hypothetical protein